MDTNSTVYGIEIVIGAVLPFFIDLINKYVKSGNWKYVISLVISLVVGAVLSYQDLSLANVLASGAIVFAAAQTVYKTYYGDSQLRTKLTGIK